MTKDTHNSNNQNSSVTQQEIKFSSPQSPRHSSPRRSASNRSLLPKRFFHLQRNKSSNRSTGSSSRSHDSASNNENGNTNRLKRFMDNRRRNSTSNGDNSSMNSSHSHSKNRSNKNKQHIAKKEQNNNSNDNNDETNNKELDSNNTSPRPKSHNIFQVIHDFFLPSHHNNNENDTIPPRTITTRTNSSSSSSSNHKRIAPKVLLYNCHNAKEHYAYIDSIISNIRINNLHGLHGLQQIGFNYVTIPCTCCCNDIDNSKNKNCEECPHHNQQTKLFHVPSSTYITKQNRKTYIADGEMYEHVVMLCQEYAQELMMKYGNLVWKDVDVGNDVDGDHGIEPIRVLVGNADDGNDNDDDDDLSYNDGGGIGLDISTDVCNLQEEEVEIDHHLSSDEITGTTSMDNSSQCHTNSVSHENGINMNGENHNDDKNNDIKNDDYDDGISLGGEDDKEEQDIKTTPISSSTPQYKKQSSQENNNNKGTLLITTGKGKVRAGIFSRQHLLVSSIESSTALPMVKDAYRRGWSIAILDPNARGDKNGMTTYETSMRVLFGHHGDDKYKDSNGATYTDVNKASSSRRSSTGTSKGLIPKSGPIFILAHSASGSQLARFLMDQPQDNNIMSRIHSIAFTDSTHNVRWLEKKKEHFHISDFFQSSSSIYIRSANEYRDDNWESHQPGDHCQTDQFWQHRFGKVKTIWAGTCDHSLTNWTTHSHIWDHFDKCHKGTK